MSIKKVKRKALKVIDNGRSTDFATPAFGVGCLYDCSYCYMKRYRNDKNLSVAENYQDILNAIGKHAAGLPEKIANQTDPKYWTYDISNNEDFALHTKYYEWEKIFDFFKETPNIKASFATKAVPKNLLSYNPEKKVRIRFSMMPQYYSDILEPNTTKIIDRIKAINTFSKAGYEVHINFSPVIVYPGWLKYYEELFKLIDEHVDCKDEVKAEVIMLTHNKQKHEFNLESDRPGEYLLWNPELQEDKVSNYGGHNLRYKLEYKKHFIKEFKELHNSIIPWNTIRYIF